MKPNKPVRPATFTNTVSENSTLQRSMSYRLRRSVNAILLLVSFDARRALRSSTAFLLIMLFTLQPSLVVAGAPGNQARQLAAANVEQTRAPGFFDRTYSWLFGNEQTSVAEPGPAPEAALVPPPSAVSGAAISRHRPSLNGGTLDGDLRVFSGESYAINSQFHLNGDLYNVGTPNITVNSGASHGGVINDGGSASPSGYGVTLNSGVVLPGKIHIRANATALPGDIPTSVPNATGTRTVNINSPADLSTIGNWATLKNLNVNPGNLTITVPPGNYDTFSMNGPNIRLVFSAGTYNFAGTVNLNSASNVQSNGAVTINIRQNLNVNNGIFGLGAGTAPSDVRINVVGSSLSVNNGSQVSALVRAINATVNLNSAVIRGHLIADYLNINSGQIIGDGNPADTTAPTLTVTSPQNNSTTQSATISVTGTATDAGSGVASVTVNGAAASYNAGTGAWTFAGLNLALGNNVITVQATDVAGNVSTQTINVTRQLPPDTTAPTVSITSPANGSTTPNATVTVTGTAADAGAGATGINRVMVNGVQAAYNAGTGQWTISGVALAEGPNTIQAVAFDNAPTPNTSSAAITVTRQTPDTGAPTVAITSPATGSTTGAATITVTGTATDSGVGATGINRVMVNGVQASYNAGTGQWTISGVALNEGPNTIQAVAFDNAPTPNSATASITVTRQTPDTTPPTVSITSPANGSTTGDGSITVTGTAADSGAGATGVNRVMVNGVQAAYNAGTGQWTISGVSLTEGANTIEAIAYDNAPTPNSATTSITVTRQTPDTTAPTVAITSPANATTTGNATITVTGTAADSGAGATGVNRVMVNGVQASYNAGTGQWTISGVALTEGANTIEAIAYDNAPTPNSASATITVTRQTPDTQAPDLAVTSPANNSETYYDTVTLTGTATDTGLNASGVSQVTVNGQAAAYNAGTGQWSLANVSLSIGDNSFLVVATDNASPANQSQLTWHVVRVAIPAPTVSILTPDNNAETTDETITVAGLASAFAHPGNSISQVTVNGTAASYDPGSGAWTLSGAAIALGSNTITAIATDSGGRTASAQITVVRNPVNQAPTVSAGADQSITMPDAATLTGTATDDGLPQGSTLAVTWSKVSGPGGVTFANGNAQATSATFSQAGDYVLRLTATDSLLTASDDVSVSVAPQNQAPVVNAGPDQSVALPNLGVLVGTATDDGLPQGSSVSSTWSKVSGPGNVTFGDAASLSTSVTFSQAGSYVLRLTATDTLLSSSDDILVTVSAQNQAPLVDAGPDQNINLPGAAALAGTVSDDGLPQGSSVAVTWSKLSGPGDITFADASAQATSATFSQAGVYVLRLSATDSVLTAFDDMTVTAAPQNQAPTVNAGPDQSVSLPNAANLTGTATDDGLPQPSTLSTVWSKVSGPGDVTFGDANAATTTATFSQTGIYVLRLTATDSEFTVSDDVTVTAAQANVPPTANFTVPTMGGPVQLIALSSSSSTAVSTVLDESRNTYWTSQPPQNTNQFIKFEIGGGEQLISGFRFQQPPFPPSHMVKDFIVQVSTTTADDSAFSTVASGTLQFNDAFQEVAIAGGAVNAKYVKFIAVNNDGGSYLALSMFQALGAGAADNIVSLPGRANAAWNGSPSQLANGGAISRSSSYGTSPIGLITGSDWKTNTKTNEFVVIKLAGSGSHMLKGLRMGANYQDYVNHWVQNFEVWTSNTVDEDSAFTKVLDGSKTSTLTEDFLFPGGAVPAKYIKYVPLSSRGNSTFIGTMALEALVDTGAGVDSFSCDSAFGRIDKALDPRNNQTAWYCEQGNGVNQWVKFRLDGTAPQKVTGVKIGGDNIAVFGAFYGPKNIQIRVSTTTSDDAAFTTVYSGTLTTTRDIQEIRFAQPVDAKYLQFYWLDGYTSYQISTHTLEVLVLAADGATITSLTSLGDANMPPERTLDLNQNLIAWQSVGGQTTNQAMTLRLYNGESFDIEHVAIRPGYNYPQTGMFPRDFQIRTSNTDDDEASFTTVYSGTLSATDLLQHFYFPSVQARYVKLVMVNNYGSSQVGLNTFFVFASNAGGTDVKFYDHSAGVGTNIVSWAWDFGDGSTSTDPNPSHSYAQAGVYDVALTVTDGNGETNTVHKNYHALPSLKPDFSHTPVNPVESDWQPNTVYFAEVSSARLSSTGQVAQINIRGTDYDIPQQSFHSTIYPDNGSYPTTIKYGADYVLNYRVTKNVSVLNQPPAVDISDGKTVYWGEPWTNTIIGMGDPGPIDRTTLAGVWNYGDGQTSTCTNCTIASAQGSHAYALPGSYTATFTITDKDGASGTDSAAYTVIKRLVTISFENQAVGDNFVLRARLRDGFSNQPLSGKPLALALNGVSVAAVTDATGLAEATIAFPAGSRIDIGTATFAGDDLYQPHTAAFSGMPGDLPPADENNSNQGTDFWLAFPPNYDTNSSQKLFVNSRVNTTVSVTGCGWTNQTFAITAGTNTQINLPSICYLYPSSFVPAEKGLHLTALAPVTVYGLNQRAFTSDAFLAIPTQSLGKDYYISSWGNLPGEPGESSLNGTQFAIIASQSNTTVTITPAVTTTDRGTATTVVRAANVPYTITLAQGRPYLLWNQVNGIQMDLTGSRVVADKPIAVYGSNITATIPQAAICCADHMVEQMAPVDTWGRRFVTMPLATRTKGDYFRYTASEDGTEVFINGAKIGTVDRGQYIERLVTDPTEIVSTKPLMVAQYATSSFFDPGPADPFMMMISPYSQWLADYTIATPGTGFTINYLNITAPTSAVGSILLDGNPIPPGSFRTIGTGGFSGAQVSISVGNHRLTGPVTFGVFVYGFSTDEGYGYPGGQNFKPAAQDRTLTLAPETGAFGINSEACVAATLTDRYANPMGGRQVSLGVTGANPSSQTGTTDAAGKYTYCYTGTSTGSDTITATFENLTATATFIWSPPNQAPTVNAGADQSITLPASATLTGTVTDDGYPSNTLTYSWTKVLGSGDVTFGTAAAVSTTASFSSAGVYVLRLTASDGQFPVSDDLTVTVSPVPPNSPPTVDAGGDQAATLNQNLVINPSAESGLVAGELTGWTEVSGDWTRHQAETGITPPSRFGDYVFAATDAPQAELMQDVDVRAYADAIDAGTQSFTWQAYVRSGLEENADSGRIILEYRDAANQTTIGSLDSAALTSTEAWQLTEEIRVPPAGTGFIRIRLLTQRNAGTTTDVYFDGMSLKAAGGGAAVKLSGTANDDGLPTGSSLVTTWTRTSGDGTVQFGSANAPGTSARFDTAGTNTLRLTATDGQYPVNDEATVTIAAANQAPVAGAGTDQTITLPATTQLNGSATDDGGTLRYRWVRVSGTGLVSFSNTRVLNPTVAFSLAGTYTLRLTVEDGELETTDDVTIVVNPAAVNQPPTVDAGPNRSVQLPANSVTLNGVATDDGLPNGNTVITWTKTAGAGNVLFSTPNAPVTGATFDAAGGYVLRLTVTDGQYTAWDEVVVTVSPAGGGGETNQPPVVVIGADQTITLAQSAALESVSLSDDGLPVGAAYSYEWTQVSGPGTATFTNPNDTATYATFSQTGVYVVRLTASDSELTGSDELTVTVAENQAGPAVEILTPADGVSITEPTAFTGTVSGGDWRLDYSLTDTDDPVHRVWTTFASGTGAASGTLGTLDTTMMLNGLYDIRLFSSDQYGQTSTDLISVSAEANLKVGNFTVSFEDMNVPVAGLPIQVTRTYDSRDKRKGDFGPGWTLGIKNLRVEKNKVLGLSWYQTRSNTFIPNYCVEATRPHIVTVTMPDGKVQKFEAKLDRQCQQAGPITESHLTFAPQPGTLGTLSVVGDNTVYVAGSVPGPVDLVGYDGNGIFDRTQFKYTGTDGTEFIINQGAGLQSLKDTNNNTLTISPGGITHSQGQSITFVRDGLGRITQMTDPAGVSNVYTYDANGDLVSYKDRENNTTSFTYEPTIPHHLKSIIDPLGRPAIRNEYDASGRLLKHFDANGEEVVYTHDLTARIETVRDRLGNPTVYEYDARGNVLVKRDALNHTTVFTYDGNDNVLTETNALGKTTTYTYDSQANRTSVTDPVGNRTEMTHNGQGRILTLKDARNNTTTNTYDTAGNLLTVTDPAGGVTTNTYSAQDGSLISRRDALDHLTTFESFNGYLKKQTDAQGHVTTFAYDNNGNLATQTVTRTNALGQPEVITTTSEYDNLGRLIKTTLADGGFTRTEYNNLGQQSATIDQAGNRTERTYDALGRLTRTTYPDGKFEESTFDDEGRRLTIMDRAGHVTAYQYDALGRLKKTVYPDGTFTQTAYDAAGHVVSSTDARGNSTTHTYDDAGRRLSSKNALDQITSFAYDANANQTSMTDALSHTTSYVYDSLNRRTRTNFADTTFTETTYDELGRKAAQMDQAGNITSYSYDTLGNLTKVKDALNHETRYEYNELGQQTKQIDALNRETRYEYDQLGRRTKRILPLGQTETYSYDTLGNLTSKRDLNGKTTTFGYDSMRRLLSKTPDAALGEPGISFTYDDLGQRATMNDATGVTTYAYDVRNRLASKQTPFGSLSYTYDDAGNIATLRSSNSNGVSVDYSYDVLNRLQAAKDNQLSGDQTTDYSYDAVGNLQSYAYPNQVTTSYAYSSLNRLTAMTVSNGQTNLASYNYTLGAAGNRTQVVEKDGRTVNYVYDDLYRLTSETISNSSNNGQIGYQYDPVGNRLQRVSNVSGVQNQNSTYDANDRSNSDVYDNNGNTKQSQGKDYNYDFENHLTSTSDGVTIVYDGDGNRVAKTVGGQTTFYLLDSNSLTGYVQVVEEIQSSVGVVRSYVYGHDLIAQHQVANGGTVNFYQYDGHGSVRQLTDASAAVTDSYVYDAFGILTERTGTTSNNYLYAGEQLDPNLAFYYNRARYLNPDVGRFISQDTYDGDQFEPKSLHKYTYAENDGVNNTDPTGNFSVGEVLSVVNNIMQLSLRAFTGIQKVRTVVETIFVAFAITRLIHALYSSTNTNTGFIMDAKLFDSTQGRVPDIGIETRVCGNSRSCPSLILRIGAGAVKTRLSYTPSGISFSGGLNIDLYEYKLAFVKFKLAAVLRVGNTIPPTTQQTTVGLELKVEDFTGTFAVANRVGIIIDQDGRINVGSTEFTNN